jgi:hypothetical protein
MHRRRSAVDVRAVDERSNDLDDRPNDERSAFYV